jgi:hypothetical protein
MPNIGVVSSVDFQNTAHQTAFQAGVANAATYTVKDKLGFNRNKIAAALVALSSNGNVNCIVTVGGLVTCHEALLNVSGKNFISLVGFLPGAPFPQPSSGSSFKGCVTLNTIGLYTTRINWITNAPWATAVANIGLLYDQNTPMAAREVAAFKAAGATGLTLNARNGLNNPDSYSDDFDQLNAAAMQSVVISAAPLFGRHKEELISAANASGLRICYPTQGYQNTGGNNKPISGRAVAIGPDLNANNGAYFLLGQMAWTVFNGGNPAQPIVTAPSQTTPI